MSLPSSLGYSMVMSLGGPVGAGIGVWCTDRFGRRHCVAIASLLGAVMSVSYALSTSPWMAVVMGFLLFCCLYTIVALAVACYIPDLFARAIVCAGMASTPCPDALHRSAHPRSR